MHRLIKGRGEELTETFSLWMPVTKSASSDDDDGDHIVQGLTSTANKDQQGEYVSQEGMDFDPLLRSGYINWNHAPGPENLIGRPLEADLKETRKGFGLWMRGKLFKGHPRADATWKLLEILDNERQSGFTDRELGWSIEGGIVRREGLRLAKSVVRHMAMTHEPINTDVYAELSRSFGRIWTNSDRFDPDTNTHHVFTDFDSFCKSVGTTVGLGNADFSPLSENPRKRGNIDPEITDVLLGKLGQKCRKGTCTRQPTGRRKSLVHLVECEGLHEDDAYALVKSLVEYLD